MEVDTLWKIPRDLPGYLRLAGVTIGTMGMAALSVSCASAWLGTRRIEDKRCTLKASRSETLASMRAELPPSMNEELLALNTKELLAKLRNRELKAEDAMRAYQAKAVAIHDRTNCLIGSIPEALEAARKLDQEEVRGALHGLPISLKDNVPLGGHVNSLGLGQQSDNLVIQDCYLVQVLKHQGAVPFVQTNLPQLLMSYESSNPAFGAVCHPEDPSRGPGGSSGGEAALIASGGSLLGFGSDIGGSIRAPCAFCGICGLKPSWDRVGYPNPPKAQTLLLPAIGPMARDVETLAIAMEALLVPEYFEREPRMPPIPYRNDIYHSTSSLTIGYYVDDGICPASPANARAVMEAKTALEAAGHRLVPWTPPETDFVMRGILRTVSADHGQSVKEALRNDIIDPCVAPYLWCISQSNFTRKLRSTLMRWVFGKPKLAQFLSYFTGQDSVAEWWGWTFQVESFRQRFAANWHQSGLDAIICPSFTFPALKRGSAFQLLHNGNYLMLYSLVNMPAGVVPVSRVTEEDIKGLDEWSKMCEDGEYVRADQQDAQGLPLAVQVAAARWNEETVLRVMKDIENRIQYQRPGLNFSSIH